MNRTYFKATRPDGTDFRTGKVRWLPAEGPIPEGGWVVEHPTSDHVVRAYASTYLSVATVATDCTGMSWPCRLLKVVPDGSQVIIPDPMTMPNTRASVRWRVVEELPAWRALGPQGREIETLLGQAESLTQDQALEMSAARVAACGAASRDAACVAASRVAAWVAAWDAACGAASRVAARDAALDATRPAAWDSAWCSVQGLMLLDLEPALAEILLAPWVSVMGRSWEVPA